MPGKAAAPRECLKVDRIDHGVRAAEDPALLERLAVLEAHDGVRRDPR